MGSLYQYEFMDLRMLLPTLNIISTIDHAQAVSPFLEPTELNSPDALFLVGPEHRFGSNQAIKVLGAQELRGYCRFS